MASVSDNTKIALIRFGAEPGGSLVPFKQSVVNAKYPRISPSGELMAYVSDRTDRDQVYLTRFPSGEGTERVSLSGGTLPRWGREGRELYFVHENQVVGVSVEPSQATPLGVTIGAPQVLFDATPSAISLELYGYDVHPDGTRFLALQATNLEASSDTIAYVQNWFGEFADKQ